jgi:hypothetical protein
MLDGGIAERAAQRAVRWASPAPRAALEAELDPLLALWRGLAHHAPYEAIVALGRVLVPALVRARRLATWGGVAEHLEGAARTAGDTATQAWARHELGTQAVATGDTARGAALLREALSMRRELGDRAGVRATRRNLRFVAPPPGPPPWMRSVVLALVTTAVALGLIAILQNGGDGNVSNGPDGTEPIAPTDETEGAGPTEDEPGTEETETAATEETEPTEETQPPTEETERETEETEPWLVTVRREGAGQGQVRSVVDGAPVTGQPDDPDVAWISCPEQCRAELQPGESIELSAEADEGSFFAGWDSEACSDAATCLVEGDSDVDLVALFEPQVVLNVFIDDDLSFGDDVTID